MKKEYIEQTLVKIDINLDDVIATSTMVGINDIAGEGKFDFEDVFKL